MTGPMASPSIASRDATLRWTLGGIHFLVILAFTWARVVRDGVLLSRIDVSWVPWLTVAILAATAALTPAIAWLARASAPGVAFARVSLATGASLVVAHLAVGESAQWRAAVLYVWVGAYGPLLVAQFWLLVHARLRADEARRMIGAIGALGIVGGATGGLVMSSLAGTLPLEQWLALTALVHGLAGAGAMALRGSEVGGETNGPQERRALRARDLLREASYARLLAAVVVTGAAIGAVVDYQFKLALQQQSTDAGRLGQWLGLFNVGVNIVALATQLLTTTLLARVGSRWMALALPSGVVAGAVTGWLVPGMWPPVLTRLWENAARHSIARTASEFFFFPFQGARRVAMKHATEGFLTRGGEVLAAALLVALTHARLAQPWSLSLVVVGLGSGWVVLVLWLGRAYGPALSQSLDQLLRPGQPAVAREPAGNLPVEELLPLLRSRNPRHVGFALDELAIVDAARARAVAPRLLTHPSARVRARARRLHAVSRVLADAPQRASAVPPSALLAALHDADESRVADACARVVAQRDRSATPVLVACLSGPSRLRARETLARLGDSVAGTLGDLLADTRELPRVRRDLAMVLGRIGTPAALAQLHRVGRDDLPALRSLALRGLNAARKRGASVLVDPAAVRADIVADLADLRVRQSQYLALLPVSGELGLLPTALAEDVAQLREDAFRRLALLHPARETLRAHRGLVSDDERIRAFALEYLDATLTPEDRDAILPMLRTPPEPTATEPDDVLAALATGSHQWIATLAVHAIGRRRARALRALVEGATLGDAVRQETVRWALARL